MNIVKGLALCAALWGASAGLAFAQHGGGFGGHGGGFSGHSSSHFAGHGGRAYGSGYHGGWGGRPGWHGGWGGGWYGGIYLDPWWGAAAYPYYDAYPGVEVAPAAPVYVEPNSAPVASQGAWYYCQNPAGYYPYVKNCNGAWQQVPAQPPAQ